MLGGFISGRGCGTETQIQLKEQLTPEDDIQALGCTLVKDQTSFIELYAKKHILGMEVNLYCLWVNGSSSCNASDGKLAAVGYSGSV